MTESEIGILKYDSEIYLNVNDILRSLDKHAKVKSEFCKESNSEYAGTESEDMCQTMFLGCQIALKELRSSFAKFASDAEEDNSKNESRLSFKEKVELQELLRRDLSPHRSKTAALQTCGISPDDRNFLIAINVHYRSRIGHCIYCSAPPGRCECGSEAWL